MKESLFVVFAVFFIPWGIVRLVAFLWTASIISIRCLAVRFQIKLPNSSSYLTSETYNNFLLLTGESKPTVLTINHMLVGLFSNGFNVVSPFKI